MTNNFVLVGRIVTIGEMKDGNKGKYCRVTVAVSRPYKDENGIYDTDYIKVTLRKELARKVTDWCQKGDLIGIRGTMECLSNHKLKLVADKVSFLATKQTTNEIKESE